MERWVLLRKGADFKSISRKFHISPYLAVLVRNRGIIGDQAIQDYLYGTIADLYDGMLMKDMDKAVEILLEKIREGARIRIIGDYDIDGVNATYILMEGLRGLGAVVDIDIPDRMTDGYGINQNLIDRAKEAGADTIITCDNGIAAAEEIAYGKSLGMTIVVTDHHEIPYREENGEKKYVLPPADAVVDPKRADCLYPFKGLCGAAVAYKLMEALYEASGKDSADIDYLMEEVAIATVGDVMDLTGENRVFVRQGLEMLQSTSNLGLKALMECTKIDPARISSYHIGFVMGPCMNASGRLDTAKRALELLDAGTKAEADILAGDLKALNDSRKDMTEDAVKQAMELVEQTAAGRDKVLVLYLPKCHESLAGIVAGRIREYYYKPVFVLTDSGEEVKGSGRSIEAYHMYEELNKCSTLLTRFGGHKLAAGLSLPRKNVERFRQGINAVCTLKEEDMQEKVSIDMELPFAQVTEEFIKELELLEPFGKGNPKPVFAQRQVEVLAARLIGKKRNMLRMQVRDSYGTSMGAVYFGDALAYLDEVERHYGAEVKRDFFAGACQRIRMSVTYYPGINEYMGEKRVQITLTHYQIT